MADLLTTALTWHAAGYSVIPIKGDGTKQPDLTAWRDYMTRQPNPDDVTAWGSSHSGMGVVCGGPMGLEMLEVEGVGLSTANTVRQLMSDNGLTDTWARIMNGYCERSPRGGLHWFLRVIDGPARGNTKLARRPDPDNPGKVQVLWETRGQGGQTVIAPSNGNTSRDGVWAVVRGTIADIPTLTVDERDAVYAILAMVDEMPVSDPPPATQARAHDSAGPRPGDDYNARATWDDLLIPRGWIKVKAMGAGWTWRRPGKTRGMSATTGQSADGVDRLYVFSSSTEFDTERPYSKFAAYTLLGHGGDWSAASKALRDLGYGAPGPDVDGWLDSLPTTAAIDTTIEDQLFNATDTLAHIRTAARARLVSPWALLAATLARIVAEIPPWVALPAIIGTRASLNLYAAIVGPSGAAKTTSVAVADDLLDLGGEYALAVVQGSGSGEGLINSFLTTDPQQKGKLVLTEHPHICLVIDEIGQIGAIQTRQGSTLAPVLRSGWSGANLDTINADPTRRRRVPKNSYRLTAVAGVQPLAARILFDDADTGTPQRWLWMPALDPHMPEQEPDWPGQLRWRQPDGTGRRDHHGNVTLTVAEPIRAALRAAHRARHHGQASDLLDGHLALTQLKVAAALAALHGSLDVDEAVWGLAGIVMEVSGHVRDDVQRQLAADRDAQAKGRGHADHLRDIGRVEAASKTVAKDAERVWKIVAAHADGRNLGSASHQPGEGCTRRCVTQWLGKRTAEQRAAAVDHAVDMTWIVTESDRLRPGPSRPAEEA